MLFSWLIGPTVDTDAVGFLRNRQMAFFHVICTSNIAMYRSSTLSVDSKQNEILTKSWNTLLLKLWRCQSWDEFCVLSTVFRHLSDPQAALESMLKPKVTSLPGHIQSVYVQNITKLYARILSKAEQEENGELVKQISKTLSDHLVLFMQSADLEVQERVSLIYNGNCTVNCWHIGKELQVSK